jgi:hypothetical protein
MMKPSTRSVLVLLLCTLSVGCDKKETKPSEDESARADAGAKVSKAASDNPELANALGAVSAARPGATAGAAGGPPPDGIFGPGEADKALPKGSPATLTLGSDGAVPRVLLASPQKPGTKRSGTIDLASQSDPQQGAIPMQFAVSIEVVKGKAEGDAGASPTQVVTKVTSAKIDAPGVPAELSMAMAKLKGSRVEYQVGADGAAVNAHTEIPKGVDAAFRDSVAGLSDLLTTVALPLPSQPVGVGAYWMVTSRDVVLGLDVVSYRLVKVEKIEGSAVTLSLNIKRYASSSAFNLEGLPPDAPRTMGEFRAQGEGSLTLTVGEALPRNAELKTMVGAALGAADAKQRLSVQVQSHASLTLGGA